MIYRKDSVELMASVTLIEQEIWECASTVIQINLWKPGPLQQAEVTSFIGMFNHCFLIPNCFIVWKISLLFPEAF